MRAIGHSGPHEDYARWPVIWRTLAWGCATTAAIIACTAGVVVAYASLVTGGLVGWWWVAIAVALPVAAWVGFTTMYDHAQHVVGRWAGTSWESSYTYARQREPDAFCYDGGEAARERDPTPGDRA